MCENNNQKGVSMPDLEAELRLHRKLGTPIHQDYDRELLLDKALFPPSKTSLITKIDNDKELGRRIVVNIAASFLACIVILLGIYLIFAILT